MRYARKVWLQPCVVRLAGESGDASPERCRGGRHSRASRVVPATVGTYVGKALGECGNCRVASPREESPVRRTLHLHRSRPSRHTADAGSKISQTSDLLSERGWRSPDSPSDSRCPRFGKFVLKFPFLERLQWRADAHDRRPSQQDLRPLSRRSTAAEGEGT